MYLVYDMHVNTKITMFKKHLLQKFQYNNIILFFTIYFNAYFFTFEQARADQFSSDRSADFLRGGGCISAPQDRTSFIFFHYCRFRFSHFIHQVMTYSIMDG